ncbi:MAG TPA: hypothetical protein VEL07_05505 [Planctomycetota bacterium]|nr:hypothetical protein [Planctomycetota bacterium]
MLRKLTPTVLALAIGASSLSAASLAERGEHIEAIKALADRGLRLPAERLVAAYAKAGYPDDGQAKAAVEFYMADVFRSAAPSPQDKEYEAAYARLQPTIEKLVETAGGKLPEDVKHLLGGGGGNSTLLRLVNDVLRWMNPDQPPPLVMTDEKVEQINRSVKGVIESAKKDYAAAKKKIEAHAAKEEEVWNLPEDSPEAMKINMDAVELRLDAMRPLYFAHLALREVVSRHAAFTSDGGKKVDPTPANDFLRTTLSSEREMLEKWDYEFSDYHPQLKLFMAIMFGEALRQEVKGVSAEDAQGHFFNQALIDRDLSMYKDPKVRDSVAKIVLKGWAGLLRWQLDMNNQKALERGADQWRDFQNRAKNDKSISLSSPDEERQRILGEIWILAGRLFAARGDQSTAGNLFSEVIAAKNVHAGNARKWLTGGGGGASSGDEWAQHPIAADPTSALTGGKAYMSEAKNANPKQQRALYLKAAVGLRSGVLGLTASAYEDQFVDTAPAVYYFYALALTKLDMPYHAAIAAHDGMRAITARITDKSNPWKDAKSGEWTQAGGMVRNLAQNSLAYISQLKAFTKGNGTDKLFAEIAKMADQIDPELGGIGATFTQAEQLVQDEKFEDAIAMLREAGQKFPDHFYKIFGRITNVRLLYATFLKDNKAKSKDAPDKLAKLIDDVQRTTEAVEKKIETDAAKPDLTEAQRKELDNAKKTCTSARISLLINGGRYEDVLTQLGAEFWKKPPTDRGLSGQMLKYLSQAVLESQKDIEKSQDAAKLVALWPLCSEAGAIFKKQAPKVEDGETVNLKGAAVRMAAAFQKASIQAAKLSGKEPKAAPIVDEARRMFAELLGPRLDDKSDPKQIRSIADTLWSLGDKSGGARLYELYKVSLDKQPDLQAYLANPAAVIDPYAAILANRSEFKKPWEELRDLLIDADGFLITFRDAENIKDLKEKKRDFPAAVDKVEAFTKLVESQKTILAGDQAKTMGDAIAKLDELVDMLATNISVSERLANYYLSSGQAVKAIPLGQWLFNDYNPRDPEYAKIYVEGVLDAVKKGTEIEPKVVEAARDIAGKNAAAVAASATQRDTYWMSYIQVLELSVALKDVKAIQANLEYLQRNKSTPRDDLILPPQPGDDPGVRRARDPLAADLAERYLRIFEHVPDVKPVFRVERLIAGGKAVPVFVDADAPAFTASLEVVDGDERIIVVPAAGAAPAADAPATDAAPAADAEAKQGE